MECGDLKLTVMCRRVFIAFFSYYYVSYYPKSGATILVDFMKDIKYENSKKTPHSFIV